MTTDSKPTPVYPLTFGEADNFTDFRPNVLPFDAPDEIEEEVEEVQGDPKDSSAQGPASTPESSQTVEESGGEPPVQSPAVKVSTPPKAPAPGS
jgi:hypothetical protein